MTAFSIKAFADETARESPALGGGSAAAYMCALGAALGTMVANLSAHKPGWDDRWDEFSRQAEEGIMLERELLRLVDEDAAAFNRIMVAFGMPKNNDVEKRLRCAAIQEATLFAAHVPLDTMRASFRVFALCRSMVETGNPNSVSDAGLGALAARSAVIGAGLNVKINAASLKDKAVAKALIDEADSIICKAVKAESEIIKKVEEIISKTV